MVKEKPVNKRKLTWMKFLATLGVIALIVLAVSAGAYSYIVWKDGTLRPLTPSFFCGNTTVNVAPTSCPVTTCAPVTNLNVTCPPPQINIYNNRSA